MSREFAESLIATIPDYPTPGVVFKDLTPVFSETAALEWVLSECARHFGESGITRIAGIEARGFILGAALAGHMNVGFVPIRKAGKLPRATHSVDYALEYGTDTLEIHQDALHRNDVVLLVDDVLATGGTATAAASLIERCDARVAGLAVLLDLTFLGGHDRFAQAYPHTEVFTVFA